MSDKLTAVGIANMVNDQKLSPADAAIPFLKNIQARNEELNALITVLDQAEVDDQCQLIDDRIRNGESLPLAGVPLVVKDNISTRGILTTCGSKMLGQFRPVFDATVVQRLRAAGAIIVGKANLDEFAMGSSNEYSAFGPSRNPWNPKKVPGGSSGGSAVAVAARMSPVALGSDTGGSIRQPAALCGVIGLKPTYGAVSRYGLVAYGSSLDQIGPFATTVQDVTRLFEVIRGHDPKDSTSYRGEYGPAEAGLSKLDLSGCKIGVIEELCNDGIAPDIKDALEKTRSTFVSLGAVVEPISIPELQYALASYYVIASAEASSNLARYDGVRYGLRDAAASSLKELYINSRSAGFGEEVKQRIMLGTFALASGFYDAYYGRATQVRKLITAKVQAALKKYDILLSPTTPSVAWDIGEKVDDPIQMYVNDICTTTANLTGSPALSIPAGFDRDSLPIGMQLMARDFEEAELLRVASAFESAQGKTDQRSAYD